MSFKRDLQTSLKGTYRSVVIFVIINVCIFLIANILINVVALGGDERTANDIIMKNFAVSGRFMEFGKHAWTLFTYMFLHISLMHILANMLWLWFLGRIFCELVGSKRMVAVYLLGGIIGGLLYLAFTALLPPSRPEGLLGASGAVMAIVVSVGVISPDYTVYPYGIAMKMKWLALICFVLTTLLNFADNTGGKVAHVGGALFGLCYGYYVRKGNPFANMFVRKAELRVAHKRGSDNDYNTLKTTVQRRIDEILDKISRSGYESLSRDEKEFLQKNHDKF